MEDMQQNGRRRFLTSLASLAGAGLALDTGTAWAGETAPVESSGWPTRFNANATAPKWDPRALPKPGDQIQEFDLEVDVSKIEILPLEEHHFYTFNGTLPGPEIRVKEGDWVKVNLLNKTRDFHTIHWHGVYVPCEMDGVPLGTQYPVGYRQTFSYLWRAQPAGTHFYHCHNMTNMHVQAGLYGALIIEAQDADIVQQTFPYERDYTLVLSEVDTEFLREQMNAMLEMGQMMEAMNGSPKLMAKMDGRMMGWFASKDAFLKAIKDGWIPPYHRSRTGPTNRIEPNFFMINGRPYPMTEHIHIKRGENIRVRLINAGMMPHFMHLHGHDFWQVCQDGTPLAAPVQCNTIPVFPGNTADIIIQGTNPGAWHFHDHSDFSGMNNGISPGGMMTMLMYEDAEAAGFKFKEIIALDS
jgi:FtsP/CotA-like multicopper oxidase with cupredoxin domain